MSPKRRGFYDQAPADPGLDVLRERNVEALIQPLIQPTRTVQRNVPTDRIRPNPFQARRSFPGIDELAQSMRVHGFISRLRVRPDPVDAGYFQLVYGERRWRAAKVAGLPDIPCEIAEHSDHDLLEIGLLENIQREDLDPLEEAQAFRTMIDQRGYTVRSLAERIGKSKGYIDNRLALLRAPDDVQQMVRVRPDTVASARLIAQLPTSAARQPLIAGLTEGSLAAKDVRTLIQDATGGAPAAETPDVSAAPSAPGMEAAARNVQHTARDRQRALTRATHAFETTLAHLEASLPLLDAAQRNALLTYIMETHLPRLEQIVELLRSDRSAQELYVRDLDR